MPVYEYSCDKHGIFALTLPLSKWDDHKPCPKCKKKSEQVLRPTERNRGFAPIVVHVDAEGNYRFPGAADARVPKHCHKVELKTIREIEKFERDVNAKMRKEADDHNSREEMRFAEVQNKNRRDLRTAMERMSPQGRDFAMFAMKQNNMRKRKTSEVGFHVQILHFDQSNREAYRDDRTGWKSRRD